MLLNSLIKMGLAAALVSFAVSILIVYSQRWHGKLSHDHDFEGVQKFHTEAVPRIGGLAVTAGIFFGVLLFSAIYPGEIKPSWFTRILTLLCASLPAFIAGMVEDVTKKVSVRLRLAATVCSALIASALLGATLDGIDIWGVDILLRLAPVAIVITAIVVAGGANAINIIDGFHGLSGSVIVVMSGALGVVAWQADDAFSAILSVLCVGATAGFLLMNYPRGKMFLGDGGAYFLGFWVSELAVLILVRNPSVNAWQVLSICAYPVIEVLFSIYRRKFIKNVNAGSADALHLHTLVYRRVVFRLLPTDANQPWKRNAAVSCFIVPPIATFAVLSVSVGATLVGAIAIVVAQVLLYVVVYARLVRGRWIARRGRALSQHPDATTSLP